jgi:LPXTG-motif cell wall-anchored protein
MAVAVVACLLVLAGPAGAANVSVDMTASLTYAPKTITVNVGDTVTWIHDSTSTPHTVTADNGSFDSSPGCPASIPACLGAGSTYQHTFTQAGTFAYHCKIHGAAGGIGMAGTIVVVAAPPPTTTTPATTPPTTAAGGGATPSNVTTTVASASGGTVAAQSTATTLAHTGASRTGTYAGAGIALLLLGAAALFARRARPAR